MDKKIRQGTPAAMAAAMAAVPILLAGADHPLPAPEGSIEERERPWWERHKVRGNHRPRKGTKPKVKKWFFVQEIPPHQVNIRTAAGQRLVRRADGIWIWPVADQRRYQEEHP